MNDKSPLDFPPSPKDTLGNHEGKRFRILTAEGEHDFLCTKHTDEELVFLLESDEFEADNQVTLTLDWMEYLDQHSLGRITQIN